VGSHLLAPHIDPTERGLKVVAAYDVDEVLGECRVARADFDVGHATTMKRIASMISSSLIGAKSSPPVRISEVSTPTLICG